MTMQDKITSFLQNGNEETRVASLPDSVRYVKNGQGGRWWPAAKQLGQVHLGWSNIPRDLLTSPGDFSAISQAHQASGGSTADTNALRHLLDRPSRHVWLTYEEGCMWWCTVKDGAHPNPEGESFAKGHFWLQCDRPWSNFSVNKGRRLDISDLPGTATTVAGFQVGP
jgi:hypothetical protein